MKTPFHKLTFLALLFSFSLAAQGPWTQKASLPSYGRHRCLTFSVGQRGYVGCGWNGVTMYQDFWEYDPGSDTWMQKQDYPGGPRLSAFGFSIGNKGYAGCGLDQFLYGQPDFYEYNPSANQWTAKATWIGVPVFGATAAVISNKGYVICGDDWDPNYFRHNEMYRYDPATNAWSYVTALPADGRRDAVGFAINGKLYVGTGNDNSYVEDSDWWEYNPANGVWTQKAAFAGSPRSQAVAWAVNGKGYVGTGGVADVNDFWQYDPATNAWTQVEDFPGQGRENAQSFVIGSKGYLVCGTSGVNYADIWEFDPLGIGAGLADNETAGALTAYPDPAADFLNLHSGAFTPGNMAYQIFDNSGRLVSEGNLEGGNDVLQVPVNDLPAGLYVWKGVCNGQEFTTRFSHQ